MKDLVGPDGKPVQVDTSCPKCGRPEKDRISSCGFGIPYLICPCGHDFEKRFICQPITP